MECAGITAEDQRGKLHEAASHQQRHAGGNGETFPTGRFQGGTVSRSAAQNDLHPGSLPVSRDGEIIFQRPVFMRATGERLEVKCWLCRIEPVIGKPCARLIERRFRQNKFIADGPWFQTAFLQQATMPFGGMNI